MYLAERKPTDSNEMPLDFWPIEVLVFTVGLVKAETYKYPLDSHLITLVSSDKSSSFAGLKVVEL